MRVLVTYASKHGSTSEVGERIALELIKGGIDVDALPVRIAGDIKGYDAVVVGSSIYFGRWMRQAVAFVERNGAEPANCPVWLFSVGPLGDQARTDPAETAGLAASLNAVDHHLFSGLLDLHRLSFPERVIINGVKAPAGDFRDWNEIDAWAGTIGHDVWLKPPSGSPALAPA